MKIRTMVVGLVAATFSMIALAQAPIVIKFSHVVAADTPKGKAPNFLPRERAN
jgi:C4-dicarboxylate-binding protein DctP